LSYSPAWFKTITKQLGKLKLSQNNRKQGRKPNNLA